MAYSTVETKIANPGEIIALAMGNPSHKRKRHANMATRKKRRLSVKQIKYFGSPAQKAALKRKRRGNPSAKRRHSKRTKKNPSLRQRYDSLKRSVKSRSFSGVKRSVSPKARLNSSRKKKRHSSHRKRTAPMKDINFVLGRRNPGRRKKGHTMARTKKRRNAGHSHRRSAKRMNTSRRRHSVRRNPAGLGRPMDWVKGGASVLGGVIITRALPQAVAPTYNTGWTGYALNAVAAIASGWAAHAFLKDAVITGGVLAGGFASIIARIISDQTSFGSYLSLTGIGDYQFSNFVTPQRIIAWQNAQVQVPQGWNGTALPPLNTALYSSDSGANC